MEIENTPVAITAPPRRDQLVEHDGKVFKTIQEGNAFILVPPHARTLLDPNAVSKIPDDRSHVQNVFYNPIQQFNRDLSVLAIKAFSEDSCARKRLRRASQLEHNSKKKERKRKREADHEQTEDQGHGGVKVPKTEAEEKPRVTVGGALGQKEGIASTSNGDVEHDTRPETVDAVREEGIRAEAATTEKPWRPQFRILDALSATGLRALRYATEIPAATAVVANDRDRGSVKNIQLNVQHNRLIDAITASTGDAQAHMYAVAFPPTHSHGPNHISGKYDVIDLDPYGTAAPFIDSALQALDDGGMLCVTCTDSGVFASCGYSEKTYALYGGMPVKGLHSHEGGLRLIIHSIATTAARYGISIEPLLSLSIDFYIRIFLRVHKSASEVKFLAGKTMLAYNCDHGCGAWATNFVGRHNHLPAKGSQINWKYSVGQAPNANRLCDHCGSKTHLAGPMWGGPLHNPAFVARILEDLENADADVYQTKPRLEGMLDTALDELSTSPVIGDMLPKYPPSSKALFSGVDEKAIIPQVLPEMQDHHPFFFIPSALCKVIKAQAPPEALIKGALRHAGYRVARSHCKPGSIKTDAPWTVIWEVMREWVRQKSPIKEDSLKEGTPGWRIMQLMRKSDDKDSNTAETNDKVPNVNGSAAGEEVAGLGGAPERIPNGTDSTLTAERLKVVFDEELGKDKPGKRLVRYQMNPRENWGPMVKAKGHG